jgi:hypothetical protein
LITVDELRAAGALDVPAAWRKSLGDDLVPGLFEGEGTFPEEHEPTPHEPEVSTPKKTSRRLVVHGK